MAKRKNIIPNAASSRLISNSGAKRVSLDAAVALGDVLVEIGEDIAEKAIMIARHSGRKTVKKEDIKLAMNNLRRG